MTPIADVVALLQNYFLNRVDLMAVLAPWGKLCPAEVNGSLDALVQAHVLGEVAPALQIMCLTRKGRVPAKGHFRLGAYAPGTDGRTRWLCVDLDGGDHANALVDPTAATLRAYGRCIELGLFAHLERSASGTGWHLWIFFDPPVSAAKARSLARALVPGDAALTSGGTADPQQGRGIEIFPKQTRLRKGGYGTAMWLPFWYGAKGDANRFFRQGADGALQVFTPSEFLTVSEQLLDEVLAAVETHPETTRSDRSQPASDEPWAAWRRKVLQALPLHTVYGPLLTGRTSGQGWLECRDPDSPTGDSDPSAGVSDGTNEHERGTFHSFISGRTISVFDFLIERGRATDFLSAAVLVGGLAQVPPPNHRDVVPSLPNIQANHRQLRDLVADVWKAVHVANRVPDLFQRTGFLVRLASAEGGPQIDLLNEDLVYGRLSRVANWVRAKGKSVIDAFPVRDVAKDMLVYPDRDLPHLERICFAPVFDAAGNVPLVPGYHAEARAWLHLPEDLRIAPVPEVPTAAVIRAARKLLLEDVLIDFPFPADSDRAHAVAACLLPFTRNLITGCTPIHDIESPIPGSGKGLLADVISILALGRTCQATTISRNEDEARKKITAILNRGQSLILIDNVRGALESSSLAAAITAEIWSDRILGQSRMVDLPNRATWIVTANNPRLSLEIARRCVRIRIDPKDDRPWQRTGFKHPELRRWVVLNRADLIWALLVLVRAWIAAGHPKGERILGSFEGYSSVMGGMLAVAEIPGFLQDVELLYEQADAEGREWRVFTAIWWEVHREAWISAGDLHRLAIEKDLLGRVLGEKGERSQKIRLGIALQGMIDRKFGSFYIVTEPDSNTGAARYRLVKEDGPRDTSDAA